MSKVPSEGEYVSPDPEKFWMKGLLKDWHVTVRYGFLPGVKKEHVLEVIDVDDVPEYVGFDGFEVFPSTVPNEDYECVVARVNSNALRYLNEQLSVLPNVNTFPTYKPHITIGYFKPGWFDENASSMEHIVRGFIKTSDLDFGKEL
jgi:2'-5' RNA ligase